MQTQSTQKPHSCFLTLLSKPEGATFSDLTGRYPIKSGRGNQHIMVCYDFDTNAILIHQVKTRKAAEVRDTTLSLLHRLKLRGSIPKMHILDNEASNSLKTTLIKNNIAYQLVPPHLHRRNMAERAIQTFKAYCITFLHTAPPKYPAKERDHLLPPCELTLTLL